MTSKTKTLLIYISTFGIAYLIAKSKAKKISETKNNEIKRPSANNFDINKLISLLGDKDNIIDVIPTISSLKVTCKNINLVNQDKIKFLGAKGSFISGNKITILIGDISYDIAKKINN